MDTDPVNIEFYKQGRVAGEKFDYFICGVLGALFAYEAQHYAPHKLAIDCSLVELASIILLALAFFCGLKRIATSGHAARLNHTLVDAKDKAKQISMLLENPDQARHASGNPITPDELKEERKKYLDQIPNIEVRFKEIAKQSGRYYRWRDRFLLAAFITIIASKILQPYYPRPDTSVPVYHCQ